MPWDGMPCLRLGSSTYEFTAGSRDSTDAVSRGGDNPMGKNLETWKQTLSGGGELTGLIGQKAGWDFQGRPETCTIRIRTDFNGQRR